MNRIFTRSAPSLLLACAAAALALAPSARAASSIGSSASDSVSESSGKISDSLTNSSAQSSKSSNPDNNHLAQGDYKVIDVAEVAGAPEMVRVTLQPVAMNVSPDQWQLTIPRKAADQGRVSLDTIVTALPRPYGVEFASGQPHEGFFLALADDWSREMKTAPVTL